MKTKNTLLQVCMRPEFAGVLFVTAALLGFSMGTVAPQVWGGRDIGSLLTPQPSVLRPSLRIARRNMRIAEAQKRLLQSLMTASQRHAILVAEAGTTDVIPTAPAPVLEQPAVVPVVKAPVIHVQKESSSAPALHAAAPETPPAETPTPVAPSGSFPAFVRAQYPVSKIPNWGAMHTAAEWNRSYSEMTADDFVPVPAYNMSVLTTPMKDVTNDSSPQAIQTVTTKLFYSTRFFGAYDLDSPEWKMVHPGVDLKLALGTPLGSIAGGRVNSVSTNAALGLHVIIEHRLPEGTFYSIYGHLGSAAVHAGQDVAPGTLIGFVGMTGNTSAPHVHLQVDRGQPGETSHIPYLPNSLPSPSEADAYVVNPIHFIEQH